MLNMVALLGWRLGHVHCQFIVRVEFELNCFMFLNVLMCYVLIIMKAFLVQFLLLTLIGGRILALNRVSSAHFVAVPSLSYTRAELLLLRPERTLPPTDLPVDVRRKSAFSARPRKRGKRGGVRLRLRNRGDRPPLPSVILSNVRSLKNKIEELRVITRTWHEYRESCFMVFTETWLHRDIPCSLVELDGFSLVRADRDENSGKSRGGGVCIYIKDKWCCQHMVRDTVCNPDVELLCLSLRPFYLPREFGNIIICAVYVPLIGNAANAARCISDCVNEQLRRTPAAPIFILGDFNQCRLELILPGYEQYIKCSTRGNRTLDKCYGNVKDAYVAKAKPPLSNCDHNTVHLIPTYKTLLKRAKPHTKTISVWSEDSIETLKGCFDSTDWDLFHEMDIETATESITDYIHFCVGSIVEKKTV